MEPLWPLLESSKKRSEVSVVERSLPIVVDWAELVEVVAVEAVVVVVVVAVLGSG